MKQLSQLQQPLINHTVFSSAQVSHLFLTQTFLNPTETQITVAMATPLLSTPQPFCSASVVNDLSLVASRWTRSHTWGTQPLCDSWLTSVSTQSAWFPLKVSHSWPPHPVVAFCNDSQSGQGPPIIESTRSLTKKMLIQVLNLRCTESESAGCGTRSLLSQQTPQCFLDPSRLEDCCLGSSLSCSLFMCSVMSDSAIPWTVPHQAPLARYVLLFPSKC